MARVAEDAKRAVLAAMRQAQDLITLPGRGAAEMQCNLERWKTGGVIFSVDQEGAELFSAFALDPNSQWCPYRVVNQVLRMFSEITPPHKVEGTISRAIRLGSEAKLAPFRSKRLVNLQLEHHSGHGGQCVQASE